MSNEVSHKYGKNCHLLNSISLSTLLTDLCRPQTTQPRLNELVELIYASLLLSVMDNEFPKIPIRVPTRMTEKHPGKLLEAEILNPHQKVVSVNLARAGTLPSHICYSRLNYLMNPELIRQDHVIASRQVDSTGHVTGTSLSGSKIGGPVDDTVLLFPDPMGATGSTLCAVIDYYKKHVEGKPTKIIAMNIIITPEYLKNISKHHPEVIVYAARLDRGLSSPEILKTPLGTHWEKEKGLDNTDYIVPGGGGIGEILNNSYV